jgi:hypothetical protein
MALLGVTRVRIEEASTKATRYDEILIDEDEDGALFWQPPEEMGVVPWVSVWALVDLGSGEPLLGVPADTPLWLLAEERSSFHATAAGVCGRACLETEASQLAVLVVRPGEEAWSGAVSDGGPGDADGRNDGRLYFDGLGLDVGRLASSAPPDELGAGDVIVGIDWRTLEVLVENAPSSLGTGDK